MVSISAAYNLQFGKGKRFLNSSGALDKLVGGWILSSVIRVSSPAPLQFTSSYCNVPGEFRAGCIPEILPGANVRAQDKRDFNTGAPLFKKTAFEPDLEHERGMGE